MPKFRLEIPIYISTVNAALSSATSSSVSRDGLYLESSKFSGIDWRIEAKFTGIRTGTQFRLYEGSTLVGSVAGSATAAIQVGSTFQFTTGTKIKNYDIAHTTGSGSSSVMQMAKIVGVTTSTATFQVHYPLAKSNLAINAANLTTLGPIFKYVADHYQGTINWAVRTHVYRYTTAAVATALHLVESTDLGANWTTVVGIALTSVSSGTTVVTSTFTPKDGGWYRLHTASSSTALIRNGYIIADMTNAKGYLNQYFIAPGALGANPVRYAINTTQHWSSVTMGAAYLSITNQTSAGITEPATLANVGGSTIISVTSGTTGSYVRSATFAFPVSCATTFAIQAGATQMGAITAAVVDNAVMFEDWVTGGGASKRFLLLYSRGR